MSTKHFCDACRNEGVSNLRVHMLRVVKKKDLKRNNIFDAVDLYDPDLCAKCVMDFAMLCDQFMAGKDLTAQ